MKRNIILLSCFLIIFGFIKAQNNRAQTFHTFNDDVYAARIRQLINAGLMDSAEQYCYYLSKQDSIYIHTFENALTAIWLKKKLNDQAYDMVLKDVDYNLRLNGGGGVPFGMLYDYTFGPDAANDNLLEQMCINKAKDVYSAYPYAESTSGIKLILLNHRMHKLNAAYNYQVSLLKNIKDSMPLYNRLQDSMDAVISSFKTLIDDHKGLFSHNEIGMPENVQFYLISSMPKLEDHVYFQPYFKEAFEAKKIDAVQYVDELIKMESFRNSDSTYLKLVGDSLAAKYYRDVSRDRTILTDNELIIINQKWDSAGHKTIDTIVRNRADIPKSPNPNVYKNLGEN